MKTRDFTKLGKQLLPYFPGFVMERNLLLRPPLGDLLRGICFERTSGASDFYVRPLFLPLFVPRDHIAFWCDRIKRNGRELWFADDPNLAANLRETIQAEAIPFLDSVSTLNGALDYLRMEVARARPRLNSHTLEGFGYTLIKAGDPPAALKALSELEGMFDSGASSWELEQRARAHLIHDKLLRSVEEALAQLEVWKAETIANLGLEKYQ